MFLRDGVVAPVDLPGLHQPQVTRRHAYERTGVAPARLEEHDLAARSAAQTVRQHTACRSAADDHKISHEAFLPLISLPLPPLVKALSSMTQLPTSPQAFQRRSTWPPGLAHAGTRQKEQQAAAC